MIKYVKRSSQIENCSTLETKIDHVNKACVILKADIQSEGNKRLEDKKGPIDILGD